jgi:hypothetical protein
MKLETKKLQVELLRVEASKAELELKIEESLADIERLKRHIEIQDKRILEITEQLNKGSK